MSNTTEAHRLAVREKLARAMGWCQGLDDNNMPDPNSFWVKGSSHEQKEPPDPYTVPADCMALMEWFKVEGGFVKYQGVAETRVTCRLRNGPELFLCHDDFKTAITEAICAALGGVK